MAVTAISYSRSAKYRQVKVLKTIVRIDNVGVFKSGVAKAIDLDKVNLIYADNARGKSTLSAIFAACSEGDEAQILQRRTVSAATTPNIHFRFQSSTGGFTRQFDGTVWKGATPNLYVFSQDFVSKNV